MTKENYKSKVYFPALIENIELFKLETKFTIVESNRLKTPTTIPVFHPKEDKQKQKLQFEKANNAFSIRNRIRFWLIELDKEIKNKKKIDFTTYYFHILEKEQFYSKTIAVKVASALFRKYTKLNGYKVSIKRELQTINKYSDEAIWKMSIEVK